MRRNCSGRDCRRGATKLSSHFRRAVAAQTIAATPSLRLSPSGIRRRLRARRRVLFCCFSSARPPAFVACGASLLRTSPLCSCETAADSVTRPAAMMPQSQAVVDSQLGRGAAARAGAVPTRGVQQGVLSWRVGFDWVVFAVVPEITFPVVWASGGSRSCKPFRRAT